MSVSSELVIRHPNRHRQKLQSPSQVMLIARRAGHRLWSWALPRHVLHPLVPKSSQVLHWSMTSVRPCLGHRQNPGQHRLLALPQQDDRCHRIQRKEAVLRPWTVHPSSTVLIYLARLLAPIDHHPPSQCNARTLYQRTVAGVSGVNGRIARSSDIMTRLVSVRGRDVKSCRMRWKGERLTSAPSHHESCDGPKAVEQALPGEFRPADPQAHRLSSWMHGRSSSKPA
jgi:hypothetical protein